MEYEIEPRAGGGNSSGSECPTIGNRIIILGSTGSGKSTLKGAGLPDAGPGAGVVIRIVRAGPSLRHFH